MSELQIAWLELVTVGGLGAILALSGVIINIVTKKQNKLCTEIHRRNCCTIWIFRRRKNVSNCRIFCEWYLLQDKEKISWCKD